MPLLLGVFSARTIIFGGLLTRVGLARPGLAALLMCAVNGPIAQLGLYNLCKWVATLGSVGWLGVHGLLSVHGWLGVDCWLGVD